MLSLKDFSSMSLKSGQLEKISGGDTPEGDYFFGYGTSTCDWKDGNGNCTYHFDDQERWRLVGDCK